MPVDARRDPRTTGTGDMGGLDHLLMHLVPSAIGVSPGHNIFISRWIVAGSG